MARAKKDKTQSELVGSAHRIWLAGLGALAVAEEEGGKLFQALVARGETFEARGKKTVEQAKSKAQQARSKASGAWTRIETGFDDAITAALHRVGVPTRKEIDTLTKRVEKLTTSIEGAAGIKKKAAPRKKVARKKPAARKTTAKKASARRKA